MVNYIPQLISRSKVSKLTGLSTSTLQRLRNNQWEEGIHYVRLNDKNIRYNSDAICMWIAFKHDPALYKEVIDEYKQQWQFKTKIDSKRRPYLEAENL